MKKNILTMMLFAVAAIASVSCQKEDQNAPAESVTLTFTSANPETKTEWNEENQTIWWSEKDKIRVACTADGKWQDGKGDVAEGDDAKFYESAGLKVSEETAKFVVPTDYKKENVGEKECQFYAVYPSSAVKLNFKAPVADVTIPSLQTSTLSFPNAADILYGKSVETHTGLPESSISMSWNRLVAHAHITLKGINGIAEKETINSITLTAQEGAALTGEFNLNVATDEFTADATSNVVTVNCTDIVADASGNVTFWACINPCTVTSLNIVVDTDRAVYTIDKTGLNCEFLVNKRNILPVNMSTADRTPKDLTGAALPFEETFESVTANNSTQISSLDGFLDMSVVYPNAGAVRIGNTSKPGMLTTELLDLSSAFYVKVKAKGKDSDELKLLVQAGDTTEELTMLTYGEEADFVEYVVNFSAIDASESIVFSTPSEVRIIVDEIIIGNGSAVAAPVISAKTPANIIGEGGEGEINYTIYNQVEGVDLTAVSSEEWLTIGSITGGKVAFTVDKNDSAEYRTATITIAYGAVSKIVVVQQEKLESGEVVAPSFATLEFILANRTSHTTQKQVWEQNGIQLVNEKSESTTNVSGDVAPAKFYKNSKISIGMSGTSIGKIEFVCNKTSYTDEVENSVKSLGNIEVKEKVVILSLTSPSQEVIIEAVAGAFWLDSVTVYSN